MSVMSGLMSFVACSERRSRHPPPPPVSVCRPAWPADTCSAPSSSTPALKTRREISAKTRIFRPGCSSSTPARKKRREISARPRMMPAGVLPTRRRWYSTSTSLVSGMIHFLNTWPTYFPPPHPTPYRGIHMSLSIATPPHTHRETANPGAGRSCRFIDSGAINRMNAPRAAVTNSGLILASPSAESEGSLQPHSVIGSRWVPKPPAVAGKLRPRRLNN
jgi:hypothetical protein